MATISLPELPKGKEFEEYIAAHFNSAGFYVDRNIILRQGNITSKAEILELDIHVTDYRQTPPNMILVELKSGEWGMADVFKIKGWMDLLNLNDGLFVTMARPNDFAPCQQVANRLQIALVPIANLKDTVSLLEPKLGAFSVDERDSGTWRFSYWLEHKLIEDLKQKKKSHKNVKRYTALDNYLNEVNNGTFFCPTIADKVDRLYDAFRSNPRISAKVAHEAEGERFDSEYDRCTERLFKETFYEAKYTDLQISTYVEHRARLAILKAAVDYCLYKTAGEHHKAGRTLEVLGMHVPIESILPQNFVAALSKIRSEPYFHLYPVFWQWFLWVFGGFVLLDQQDQEFSLLSQKSGIPIDHLDEAFAFYDLLFPIAGGWFMDVNSRMRVMKMFPVPFMGVGANYRRYYHCPNQKFEELSLSGLNARRDIVKWNNLMCDILRRSSRYKAAMKT